MREIIFRGKKDNGGWICGYYYKSYNPFTKNGLPALHVISDLPPFSAEIDPETLGQFTGLTDKNDNPIFEGDILAYVSKNSGTIRIDGVVVAEQWNCSCCDGVFGFAVDGIGDLRDFKQYEVIGNIHDNPEL